MELTIRIGHDGTVTRLADLIASVAAIDAQHDGDRTFTALALHRGDFYVGTLGRIDTGFAASVYRVSRDGRRVAEVASGFHGVVGIAFDRQDRMLVLETTDSSFPPLSNPAAGRLLRVERNGSLTPLVTNLTFPSALIAGREGEFYVSVCGFHCDRPLTGPGPRVSLESGQVLRVDVDRHPSWRDDDED